MKNLLRCGDGRPEFALQPRRARQDRLVPKPPSVGLIHRRKDLRGAIGLTCLLVLLALVAIVLLIRAAGFPLVVNRVSDAGHRVSVEIPKGWRFEAPSDGGVMSVDRGSSGSTTPERVPDLVASDWSDGADGNFTILILSTDQSATIEELHQQHVNEICQDSPSCASDSPEAPAQLADNKIETVYGNIYIGTARYQNHLIYFEGTGSSKTLRTIWTSARG